MLGLHAVDVKALDEHPGKGGHEEIMQQDGDHSAQELGGVRGSGYNIIKPGIPKNAIIFIDFVARTDEARTQHELVLNNTH